MVRCILSVVAAFAIVSQASIIANNNVQSISPVQKVIAMIDDFAGKVQKDLDAGVKTFEAEMNFCDGEATEKAYAIKDSNGEIESLTANTENSKAKLVEYTTNIEDASARISATEGEMYKAGQVRDAAHKEFLANEKELLNTADELENSSRELKKQLAFTQMTPVAKKNLKRVMAGLSQVVEASFITHAQREKVHAFLQARADAEDDLTLSSSNDGDNAVVGTIDQMNEKAEVTLTDTRKAEMQSNHEYAMLKQGLEREIASTTAELNENTKAKQVATGAIAQAQKDLAVVRKALSEDTTYLNELKRGCQSKARDWEEEHRDGQAELKALSSAKGILTKKFEAAFLQAGFKWGSQLKLWIAVKTSDNDDAKTRALRAIQQLGAKYHSTALIALAYSAASDPFGKVRGMIEGMIEKLQHEAAEEATQKAFCDEEMGKSQASKDDKEEKLETINARIEKAESSTAVLAGQVSTLSKELAQIDASTRETTEIRQAENTAFRTAEKDFAESQTACAQALEILREYYEGAGASLAQLGAVTKSDVVADTSGGSGIIAVLELAESDFGRMLADARTGEEAAANEFEKLSTDNKFSKATKEAERKGKESEMSSIKAALANNNEDKDGISSELDAVLQYLSELKPQCETKVPSYAEVKAKREAEINGLKDALKILEDSA